MGGQQRGQGAGWRRFQAVPGSTADGESRKAEVKEDLQEERGSHRENDMAAPPRYLEGSPSLVVLRRGSTHLGGGPVRPLHGLCFGLSPQTWVPSGGHPFWWLVGADSMSASILQ